MAEESGIVPATPSVPTERSRSTGMRLAGLISANQSGEGNGLAMTNSWSSPFSARMTSTFRTKGDPFMP